MGRPGPSWGQGKPSRRHDKGLHEGREELIVSRAIAPGPLVSRPIGGPAGYPAARGTPRGCGSPRLPQ